jgi:hypothetical protein
LETNGLDVLPGESKGMRHRAASISVWRKENKGPMFFLSEVLLLTKIVTKSFFHFSKNMFEPEWLPRGGKRPALVCPFEALR